MNRRERRFVIPVHKWEQLALTWRLDSENLNAGDQFVIRNTLHRGFNFWEEASKLLSFKELKHSEKGAHLNIRFLRGNHGDDMPFDGPDGVIGHAFYPPIGELHVDADEQWTLNGLNGTDLLQTLTHEIGHLLGLEHSSDPRAVMYPRKKEHQPGFELSDDDVRAIRFFWLCSDVWWDILPFFDRPQLGFKLALISPRFNVLINKHFDCKREWTIWRTITIRRKNSVIATPEFAVFIDVGNSVTFPLPDRPLPYKIRFKSLKICYIDYAVIAFLRSNQQMSNNGTKLRLNVPFSQFADDHHVWDAFGHEIWPIFATNIRFLGFIDDDHLDKLRRRTSPTMLTDHNQLHSIDSFYLSPAAIADFEEPNATTSVGQMLSKWLHCSRTDGKPNRLSCLLKESNDVEWINNFKEKFHNATTSVRYKIQFIHPSMPIVPFEFTNEQTKEKLTLTKAIENQSDNRWIINRGPISEKAATIQWEDENLDALNNVDFVFFPVKHCIG
ncbi:hypothetical protein niasHT_014150 [Heterodera trifolii]|uniref:Peptidase metallopeptidase domain-containing protein n=1 Tax=Heterodera trifolii TaxID=157864 RepID=A0ABD2KX04_9BILA